MALFEKFLEKSKYKMSKVGIGVGTSQNQYRIIIDGILNYLKYNKADIFLFCYDVDIQETLNNEFGTKLKSNIKFITSDHPERKMIEYLKNHRLDGVIRGGLSSNEFLKSVNEQFNKYKINRLALLETVYGHQFFFGPVGIDECNDLDSKIIYLEQTLRIFKLMDIKPKISVLSGGRKGDLGRSASVDQSIKEAISVVSRLREKHPNLTINHHEILIEKAIAEESNLILAPNGISGNLIYRTLVHLGGGKAFGAIYLGMDPIIIDTSRVGKSSEIEGALVLANALYEL
jgi:putative methanogen marker protein 4